MYKIEFPYPQLAHSAQVNYDWILVLTWNNCNVGNCLRYMRVALALSIYAHFSCTSSRIHMGVFDKWLKNFVGYLHYIADTPWYGKLLYVIKIDMQQFNLWLSGKLNFTKPEVIHTREKTWVKVGCRCF